MVVTCFQQAKRQEGGHLTGNQQQSEADLWLNQLDIKHLNKFHIQLFLQHKLQLQQMQASLTPSYEFFSDQTFRNIFTRTLLQNFFGSNFFFIEVEIKLLESKFSFNSQNIIHFL